MTATLQADVYIYPKCHSNGIKMGYSHIEYFTYGWSEPLIDFPVNWDWHRHYCRKYGQPDPGPCKPPEHSIEELQSQVQLRQKKGDG